MTLLHTDSFPLMASSLLSYDFQICCVISNLQKYQEHRRQWMGEFYGPGSLPGPGPGPGRGPHHFCLISSELELGRKEFLIAWEAEEFSQAFAHPRRKGTCICPHLLVFAHICLYLFISYNFFFGEQILDSCQKEVKVWRQNHINKKITLYFIQLVVLIYQ